MFARNIFLPSDSLTKLLWRKYSEVCEIYGLIFTSGYDMYGEIIITYILGNFAFNMWRYFLRSDFVDPVCMKYMEIFLWRSFQGIFHAIEFQRDDLLKAEWLIMFLIYFIGPKNTLGPICGSGCHSLNDLLQR